MVLEGVPLPASGMGLNAQGRTRNPSAGLSPISCSQSCPSWLILMRPAVQSASQGHAFASTLGCSWKPIIFSPEVPIGSSTRQWSPLRTVSELTQQMMTASGHTCRLGLEGPGTRLLILSCAFSEYPQEWNQNSYYEADRGTPKQATGSRGFVYWLSWEIRRAGRSKNPSCAEKNIPRHDLS